MSLSQMRSFAIRSLCVLGALLPTLATACHAQALPARPALPVRPQPATVILGSLTLSPTTSTLNFNLVRGGVSDTQSVTFTTSWLALGLGTDPLDIYGYFSNPMIALQNSANASFVIPSASVFGQATGTGALATSFTPFSQTTPFSGASGLHLVNNNVSFLLLGLGSQTDTVSLQINLAGQPNLPAGTYVGTLTLEVVVN